MSTQFQKWTALPAPGIRRALVPVMASRALERACEAVDADVEQFGRVTYETVEMVRSALALVRAAA